jgi:hypothetical protein
MSVDTYSVDFRFIRRVACFTFPSFCLTTPIQPISGTFRAHEHVDEYLFRAYYPVSLQGWNQWAHRRKS